MNKKQIAHILISITFVICSFVIFGLNIKYQYEWLHSFDFFTYLITSFHVALTINSILNRLIRKQSAFLRYFIAVMLSINSFAMYSAFLIPSYQHEGGEGALIGTAIIWFFGGIILLLSALISNSVQVYRTIQKVGESSGEVQEIVR